MKKWVKNESLAAFIISFLLVLIISTILVFLANSLAAQARVNYVYVKQKLATGFFSEEECVEQDLFCRVGNFLEEQLEEPVIKDQLSSMLYKTTDFLVTKAGQFLFSIPGMVLDFFIMVFILYYLLKMGEKSLKRVERLLPLKKKNREHIIKKLNEVTYAVIYGHIVVAGIQAILGGIFLWIFGVSAPILWGVVMFFLALLPFVGTPLVWGPAMIVKLFSGHPVQAAGLLITGLFVSSIDNFIKPKIVAMKGKVHPVLVLLGVIGGLSLFGFIGIIIGPVILSIFMTFLDLYEAGKIETKS